MQLSERDYQAIVKKRREEKGVATPRRRAPLALDAGYKTPPATYDSQLEADYATYLWGLEKAVDILGWRYHPWTFLLPGGVKYTPDFVVIDESIEHSGGQVWVEIHEIKGDRKMKNARDGITRFRIAKGLFPWFRFKLIERVGRQWRQVG